MMKRLQLVAAVSLLVLVCANGILSMETRAELRAAQAELAHLQACVDACSDAGMVQVHTDEGCSCITQTVFDMHARVARRE